jgi:uncharacterized protein (DUF58 family)
VWRLSYWLLYGLSGAWFAIRRRLSHSGSVVAGMLVVAAALGVDTTQSLAYQMFALAAAALLVSVVLSRFARLQVEVRRDTPRVVSVGQIFSYPASVRNIGTRPSGPLWLFEDAADPRPSFDEFRRLRFPSYRGWWRLVAQAQIADMQSPVLPPLEPGASAEARIDAVAYRRGTLILHGVTVAQNEPFGLIRRLARVAQPGKITVLPRRYALPPVNLPGSRRYQHGGVTLSQSVGDSEEFISLREYRPGDPLQRIHWKSFARAGQPVVREYQDEFFERHALVLDTFGPAGEIFEEGVSVAASFACTLDTQECLLDLLFVGAQPHCFTAGRGQLPSAQLVEILSGVRPCTDKPFQSLVDSVLARRASLSGSILILLAWDEARRALVERLRTSVPLKVLVVARSDFDGRPAWLRLLRLGKIQEDLAKL